MPHRRRYKQTKPFQDRLFDFLAEARQKIEEAPDGIEREKMIKKIESARTAARIDSWANSSKMQRLKLRSRVVWVAV
jgi:hypothetical protein